MEQFTNNPRLWSDSDRAKLKANLQELGDISGIVHDENSNELPCGNFRSDIINIHKCEIEITKEFDKPDAQGTVALGYVIWEGNHYNYRRVNWTKEQCEKACLTANALGGKWDYEELMSGDWDKALLELCNIEFPEDIEDLLNGYTSSEDKKKEAHSSLQEKFIIPPFSILDTRQGYWQDRKQAWLNLGIKSEESRENMKVSGSFSGTIPDYYTQKNRVEQELGHTLTNKEFETKYVPDLIKGKNLAYTDTGGLLSIFDPVLCEIAYRWFCPSGGQIYDPFAGGSVRGVVAGHLGYKYTGVDLREDQVLANEKQRDKLIPGTQVNWITGNSLNTSKLCKGLKADMIFSCPPYFDLEIYSDEQEDLSNMSWSEFQEQYSSIIKQSVDLLNDDSFACFVVGDIRDKKTGFYHNLLNETIKAFEDAGSNYYNEIILMTVLGSLPIRVTKQFNASRKIGKCHQNVLVFYKGNPKNIKSKFQEIDFSEEEL